MAKKILDPEFRQEFFNGVECGHEKCGHQTKQCPHCGRIAAWGNVVIRNRTGCVHLERLNSTNKMFHLKKSIEEQEQSTINLWIGPYESAELL